VLGAVLLLAPLLGYLPMASLAALLLLVAWNMSNRKGRLRIARSFERGIALARQTLGVVPEQPQTEPARP
jgi:SulP family sulfate permease